MLVANKVRAKDGHWLSLDARELFCHQKAAGMLYKAALRAELTARCGVSWTAVDDNGIAEVEGVPIELCDAWSARRHAVKAASDALVAERGATLGRSLTSSERAQCFQLAAYRTRTPKVDAETPTEVLKERCHEEAVGFGQDPERFLAGVLGHERTVVVTPGIEELSSVLARLEERAATWTRADVAEECARLVEGPDAASVRRAVEAVADEVLRGPEVVSLEAPLPVEAPELLRREDGMAQLERHGGRRFSTTGTLRREAAVLEAAAAGAGAGIGIVPEVVVTSAISAARLGEDQEAAVRGLLGGGEQVALLVGPAGSGKSRALWAARTAWAASGHEVVGAAPSAMAADVLEEATGIAPDTLAKLLGELERGRLVLSPRSVVVDDEAGIARSDDLARIVGAVQAASAKVVLVGDPHQLGAVGPGGLFRTLVDDHGAHELETIRRFSHAWEAAASLRLRARDPSILPAYVAHDRILEGSRPAMLDAALLAWREGRARGRDVLVMAGDNATADELSRRCRGERVMAGEVEAGGVAIASGNAGVGDEVVTLRNDRSLRTGDGDFVRNGARWRVVERDETGALHLEPLAGGGRVRLPADYVASHVGLAYALTIHKAQGTTSDEALVLVDDTMTAAQLYVAMSRGREENRALVVTDTVDPDEHVRPVGISGIEQLVQVLRRDGTDRSAHEVLCNKLARSEDRELLRGLQVVRGSPPLRCFVLICPARSARGCERTGASAKTTSPSRVGASSGRSVSSRPAGTASLPPSSSAPSSRRSETSSGPAMPTSTRIQTRWTLPARFGGCFGTTVADSGRTPLSRAGVRPRPSCVVAGRRGMRLLLRPRRRRSRGRGPRSGRRGRGASAGLPAGSGWSATPPDQPGGASLWAAVSSSGEIGVTCARSVRRRPKGRWIPADPSRRSVCRGGALRSSVTRAQISRYASAAARPLDDAPCGSERKNLSRGVDLVVAVRGHGERSPSACNGKRGSLACRSTSSPSGTTTPTRWTSLPTTRSAGSPRWARSTANCRRQAPGCSPPACTRRRRPPSCARHPRACR